VPAEGLQNVTLLEGLPHCKDVVSSVQGNYFLRVFANILIINFYKIINIKEYIIGIDTDITCIHWNVSDYQYILNITIVKWR